MTILTSHNTLLSPVSTTLLGYVQSTASHEVPLAHLVENGKGGFGQAAVAEERLQAGSVP